MSEHAERYFDERMETLPPEQLRKLQDHRLRWQFRRCWDGSEWYRARFEAAGLTPETFGGLTDLQRLPLMADANLRSLDDAAWLVAPAAWITSTTEYASHLVRSQSYGDVVHELDRSARWRWSAGVVRPAQASLAGEIGKSVYVRLGKSPASGGAAPAAEVEQAAGHCLRLLDVPLVGDRAAYECDECTGFHWVEDQFLAEVINQVTGEPVPDSSPGELVVTDLVREASPLVRYRTGLVVSMSHEPCACGRTSGRVRATRTQP